MLFDLGNVIFLIIVNKFIRIDNILRDAVERPMKTSDWNLAIAVDSFVTTTHVC